MNWTFIVGLIVFLVVFAAVWGAFPRASKTKPRESDFVALPPRGEFDHAHVPEFRSSWRDSR
jgi:hypothetical protein